MTALTPLPDMASILSGPHIKSLHDFGEGPLVIIEPLAVVPVRHATEHRAAPLSPKSETARPHTSVYPTFARG